MNSAKTGWAAWKVKCCRQEKTINIFLLLIGDWCTLSIGNWQWSLISNGLHFSFNWIWLHRKKATMYRLTKSSKSFCWSNKNSKKSKQWHFYCISFRVLITICTLCIVHKAHHFESVMVRVWCFYDQKKLFTCNCTIGVGNWPADTNGEWSQSSR